MWKFYERIEEQAQADSICKLNLIYYACWFGVNLLLIVLRMFSFTYMFKSYRYLHKREIEKMKKTERKKEKEKRIKREKKKELEKLVAA